MLDTDTFFTAVYTVLDDLYRATLAELRQQTPGRRPQLSDSEVLTLIVLSHWYGLSERALLRRAAAAWQPYFPRLLSQSAFNRRVHSLERVLTWLVTRLAAELGATDAPYEVLDGVSVPLARLCRGTRHRQFAAEADIGKGGSDRQWYYGIKLLLCTLPCGAVSGFVAGPASTEERVLAEALLQGRAQPPPAPWQGALPPQATRHVAKPYVGANGPLWPRLGVGQAATGRYLGDRGYGGAWWETHWQTELGARVVTPYASVADDRVAQQAHASLRQIVETTNSHLKGDLGLAYPRAHTFAGLRARLAAKLVSFNLGIVLNRRFQRPDLALATLAA
ncbi:MAG: hypothetical protein ACHQ4H_19325 [Ktedonobacterales bacterium]